MRTLPRVGAGLLALTLAGGITACGDDDDDVGATDTTEAGTPVEGDDAAFCEALIGFNSAAFEIELDETSAPEDVKAAGETLAPLSTALVDNAPQDLADAAAEIDAFVQPLLDGDAEQFNADSTFETYLGFVGQATEACDFAEVEVEARDYAFAAPDTIAAGNAAFTFTNTSEAEDHEMVLLGKADGVDLTWDEILALPEDEGEPMTEFLGVALAPPGESASTLATLEAGDYAMVCFLPLGGAEDGPPHFTQGMVHEFTVE